MIRNPFKQSEYLFQLIKSLSMQEKRYFKMFASLQKSDKIYLQLFDAMDRQEKYNENEIRKSLSPNLQKQLPFYKNYLYNRILKGLSQYHGGKSVQAQVRELISHAEILMRKNLYDQCKKVLSKAKTLAEQYEIHLFLLEIITLEKELMRLQLSAGKTARDLEKINKEEHLLLERHKNTVDYNLLYSKTYLLHIGESVTRSPRKIKKYEALLSTSLLKNKSNASSSQSLLYYYNVHQLHCLAKGDTASHNKYQKKIIGLLEANPHLISQRPMNYIAALNNLLIGLVRLGQYDEFKIILKKLKSLSDENISDTANIRIFLTSHSRELDLYIHTAQFHKATELINEISAGIDRYKGKIIEEYQIDFHYKFAYSYFALNKFAASLQWVNKLLNEHDTSRLPDVHCFVRILNMVLHFEIGNWDLLRHLVKSTSGFLMRKHHLYHFETEILNSIRKRLFNIDNQKQRIANFIELKSRLVEITTNPLEQKALIYFDFISWLESKIENRTFAEVVRGKAKLLR